MILALLTLVFYFYLIYLGIKTFVNITSKICESPACLIGKTAIVTGGNQGLGYETALSLASRGCRVIIADIKDGTEAVEKLKQETDNHNIVYKHLNLASFASIRGFVSDIIKNEEKLHILINNAGNIRFGHRKSEDGLNLGMATNHYGSFLLTYLLTDLLKKSAPSRIVFVSSKLAYLHNLDETALLEPKKEESRLRLEWTLYCNTKMCNIVTADLFAEKLKGTGVTSNSVHPGLVGTALFSRFTLFNPLQNWLRDQVLALISKDARQGAQTTIYAAVAKGIEKSTGIFFSECSPANKPSLAYNTKFCQKLWEFSEELTKIEPHEKL